MSFATSDVDVVSIRSVVSRRTSTTGVGVERGALIPMRKSPLCSPEA